MGHYIAVVRRPLMLVPGLVIPLLHAAPAFAADNVICVNTTGGGLCNQTVATIPLAISAAGANAVPDRILVGPGEYTDGPYHLDGTPHAVSLEGAGQGLTVLTLAPGASQAYVDADGAIVRDLSITMTGVTSDADEGLNASESTVIERVTINGSGLSNATGLHIQDSTASDVQVLVATTGGNRGVYSEGGTSIVGGTIVGGSAYELSEPGAVDTLSLLRIRGASAGVTLDQGTVDIDNSVIDLGTGDGTGLQAANFNAGPSPKTIQANHVTIVGGGAGSRGVWAYAATPTVKTTATVVLTNSIISGPETSIAVEADNNGSQAGDSTATATVSYTDADLSDAAVTIGPTARAGSPRARATSTSPPASSTPRAPTTGWWRVHRWWTRATLPPGAPRSTCRGPLV